MWYVRSIFEVWALIFFGCGAHRANVRVLAVVVAVAAVAACNALIVPLRLEHQIEVHRRSPSILAGFSAGQFGAAVAERAPWALQGPLEGLGVAYRQKGCENMDLLRRWVDLNSSMLVRFCKTINACACIEGHLQCSLGAGSC